MQKANFKGPGELYLHTVSDGVKGPLVVLEERVSLDFLHAVPAQSHLPQDKDSKWVVEQWVTRPFVLVSGKHEQRSFLKVTK